MLSWHRLKSTSCVCFLTVREVAAGEGSERLGEMNSLQEEKQRAVYLCSVTHSSRAKSSPLHGLDGRGACGLVMPVMLISKNGSEINPVYSCKA